MQKKATQNEKTELHFQQEMMSCTFVLATSTHREVFTQRKKITSCIVCLRMIYAYLKHGTTYRDLTDKSWLKIYNH